jgi:hypothetical protein
VGAAQVTGAKDEALVFADERGKPLDRSVVFRAKRAGVP